MASSPSPGSVATNLSDVLTKMPSLAPLDYLIGNLSDAETVLYDSTAGFPTTDTAALLTWLANVRWVITADLAMAYGCTRLSNIGTASDVTAVLTGACFLL
jgi:hypothetical protein